MSNQKMLIFSTALFFLLLCWGMVSMENEFYVEKKQDLEIKRDALKEEKEKLEQRKDDILFSIKMSEMKKETEGKIMEISAYSEIDSCHYRTEKGCLTASGKIAKVGMIATNLYPFGTKLKIGDETYIVEDRISKRYNNRLDIFCGYGKEAHQTALQKGIQYKLVSVIK